MYSAERWLNFYDKFDLVTKSSVFYPRIQQVLLRRTSQNDRVQKNTIQVIQIII